MKHIYILLLIIIFFSKNTLSQVNKTISFESSTVSSNIVKINNNYFTANPINWTQGIRIMKLNKYGDTTVKRIEIDTLTMMVGQRSLCANNNNQLVVYHVSSNQNGIKIGLTCFSTDFDTIWSQTFSLFDSLDILVRKIIQTNDGGYALVGATDMPNSTYQAFLIKTDNLGNQEWIKYYGYDYNDEFMGVVQTEDGDYILSGGSNQSLGYYGYCWYIVRTDSLGNQIWDWRTTEIDDCYEYHTPGAITELIQTQDGNFIAVGKKAYTVEDGHYFDGRLLKFDINKNVIADTLFSEPYDDRKEYNYKDCKFNNIVEDNNGNLFIIGYYKIYSNSNRESTKLYKLDSDLNLLETRLFKASSIYYVDENIRSIITEDDGSLVMIGDFDKYQDTTIQGAMQQIWFIKTDENYCDGYGSCDTSLTVEFFNLPDTANMKDTYEIKYKISGSTLSDTFNIYFTFQIRSIVYKGEILHYNILQDSIYSFEISADIINNMPSREDELLETGDSVNFGYILKATDPTSRAYIITFGNAYIINFVQGSSIAELNQTKQLKLYPNPAKNNVQFTTNNYQLPNTDVFIYDIYGKVVQQLPIKNYQKEITLDVSSLQSGIYFVKLGDAFGKFVKE